MGGNAESSISICKSKANKKEMKSEESVHNLTGNLFSKVIFMCLETPGKNKLKPSWFRLEVGVCSTNGSGYFSGISLEISMPHQI